MGHELYRMILAGAPPDWTTPMRQVAGVIADDARDPSQGPPDDGGWPWSAIPVRGCWTRDGGWRDGIAEKTGMSERAISRALTDLARAGYEMREPLGRGKNGRLAFTAPERGMRFRVPLLEPRKPPERPPEMATERPPDTATDRRRPPETASSDGRQKRRNGRRKWRERSPESATPSPQGPPIVPPAPQSSVVNGPLEGVRDRQGDDDLDLTDPRKMLARYGAAEGEIEPILALIAPHTADPAGYLRKHSGDPGEFMRWARDQLGARYGSCGVCGKRYRVRDDGLLQDHGPRHHRCKGSRQPPAEAEQ